jgi:hypothetical protein
MNSNSINGYSDIINQIIFLTKDKKINDSLSEVYKKYSEIEHKNKLRLVKDMLESLKWIAEKTKSSDKVKEAVRLFLLDSVINTTTKYSGDIADQIFTSLQYCIEESLDKNTVEKYSRWMNNGHIGKLLDFAADLNGNGNIKLKRDILSILFLNWNKIDDFDEYATKISNKKLFLEQKIELFSILRDIVNTGKEQYAEILVRQGVEAVGKNLQNDLNRIKNFKDVSSIRVGIKFLNDMKNFNDADFLFLKSKEFGNVKNWLFNDSSTKSVIEQMKKVGFDTDFFVASGHMIAQKTGEGHYSDNWSDVVRSIVIRIVGSRKDKTLPKISIPNVAPGSFYKKLKDNYQKSLAGNKESAKKVLKEIKLSIIKNFARRRMPLAAVEILNDIEMLEKVLDYGGTVTFRGAKVVAKVWKRRIPDDLYDSENLWCCIFFPDNEYGEIPLLLMDPKTTLIQFFTEGLNDPVSCAFTYAGLSEGKTTIFVDTVELGALAYAALGQDKTKEFCYESILKFGKKAGADRLIFFAKPGYGRSVEFCSYLRDIGLEEKKVSFEAIDSDDSVLKKFSSSKKHHYTDAFGSKSLKGKIKGFVVEI